MKRDAMNRSEPKLRPEFVRKMKRLEKKEGIPFKSIAELRRVIEKG